MHRFLLSALDLVIEWHVDEGVSIHNATRDGVDLLLLRICHNCCRLAIAYLHEFCVSL